MKTLENGIYEHFVKKVVSTFVNYFGSSKKCVEFRNDDDEEPEISVKLESLKYIFALFFLVVFISFIMFLFEIREHRINGQ